MNNFDDHIVVFIDLLGFKNFNKEQNIETRKKLIAALREIKNLDSNAAVQKNNNIKYCRLESNFSSDSLMLAWPLKHQELPDHFSQHIISGSIIYQVAQIAIRALSFGLLIRGAITVGEFYHEDGIFCGQAFDEAHYLESTVAFYPRIIISDRIFNKNLISGPLDQNSPNCYKIWLTDLDHINYLNYLSASAFLQAFWPSDRNSPLDQRHLDKVRQDWIEDSSKIINEKISLYNNNPKILQKWGWYHNYFKNSIITSLPEFFK